MTKRVKLNISGTRFEFDRIVLLENDLEFVRLSRMVNEALRHDQPLEFTVDRPPESFAAILAFYQTGDLHLPANICPGSFKKELEFWEVSSNCLADCCSYSYHAFFDELKTRKTFQKESMAPKEADVILPVLTSFPLLRKRIWSIVDFHESTIISKTYFCSVLAIIILSVLSLAFSTDPHFRRNVSKCELLEYVDSADHHHKEQIKNVIGDIDCSAPDITYGYDYNEKIGDDMHWYYYDGEDENSEDSGISTAPSDISTAPSDISTAPSDNLNRPSDNSNIPSDNPGAPPIDSNPAPSRQKIDVPKITIPKDYFKFIDIITLIFFSIDIIIRLTSCPSIIRYFLSVINVFDASAIIGSYIYLIVIHWEKEYKYEQSSWVAAITYTQIFRALRLFRVVKNVRASKVLAYSMRQNLRDVSLLAVLLITAVSVFSCLLYFIEDRDTVVSIPEAWYWSMITMTTVGYGDITPKTTFGRVLASVCACCGVLLLALTLPMFVNSFLTLYQYSCVHEIIENNKMQKQKFKSAVLAVDIAHRRSVGHDDGVFLRHGINKKEKIPANQNTQVWTVKSIENIQNNNSEGQTHTSDGQTHTSDGQTHTSDGQTHTSDGQADQ